LRVLQRKFSKYKNPSSRFSMMNAGAFFIPVMEPYERANLLRFRAILRHPLLQLKQNVPSWTRQFAGRAQGMVYLVLLERMLESVEHARCLRNCATGKTARALFFPLPASPAIGDLSNDTSITGGASNHFNCRRGPS